MSSGTKMTPAEMRERIQRQVREGAGCLDADVRKALREGEWSELRWGGSWHASQHFLEILRERAQHLKSIGSPSESLEQCVSDLEQVHATVSLFSTRVRSVAVVMFVSRDGVPLAAYSHELSAGKDGSV